MTAITKPEMNPLVLVVFGSIAYGAAAASIAVALARANQTAADLLTARKVFHVMVFTGAVPAQLLAGFWGVVAYGSVVSVLLLLSAARGEASALYRALVRRERSTSARTSILVPLLATGLGGLTGAVLVGDFAVVGFMVGGWGDAAGEWVGRRWGRHRYPSPFQAGLKTRRSIEGSVGVVVVGWAAGWVALRILGVGGLGAPGAALACALTGAGAEALSGEGTDNFWMQVVPALTGWWLVG